MHFDKCSHLSKEHHRHKTEHEVVKKDMGILIFVGYVLKFGIPYRADLGDMEAG